jgi:hypothetical protein
MPHSSQGKGKVWFAPEHGRVAMGMRRDYPRDDWGFPIRGSEKELVVDPRPQIMVENKKKYEHNRSLKDRRPKVPEKPNNHPRKAPLPFSNGRWSFDPGQEES